MRSRSATLPRWKVKPAPWLGWLPSHVLLKPFQAMFCGAVGHMQSYTPNGLSGFGQGRVTGIEQGVSVAILSVFQTCQAPF